MNAYIIDIIFVIFLVVMTILGYIKGFVTRLYDLVSLIIVLCLTYFLAQPLSHIITIYQYDQTDVFSQFVGSFINQLVVGTLLFVVLFIIKKIIGIALKPILKGTVHTFHLTTFIDKVLGMLLSLVEAVFIAYLAITFVLIPFYKEGAQQLPNTQITKHVLKIMPVISEQMGELGNFIQDVDTDSYSLQTAIQMLLIADDLGLLDEQQVNALLKEDVLQNIKDKDVTITSSQKQQLEEFMNKKGYNKKWEEISKYINVSGE